MVNKFTLMMTLNKLVNNQLEIISNKLGNILNKLGVRISNNEGELY